MTGRRSADWYGADVDDVCERKDSAPSRWAPDLQLIPAVIAGGGRKMSQLSLADRCWVVAGMTALGLTAGEIADRLGCSLRLVRSIRAEDMTAMCVYVQSETRNFTDELRLAQTHSRAQTVRISELSRELERTRAKLGRMIDTYVTGERLCPKCGTPMDRWNAYVCNGKNYCRACHRERSRIYRERRKQFAGLPFAVARDR